MNKLKHYIYYLTALWIYRKIPANEVCCCGASIIDGLGCSDYYCPSRCAKEYAITSYVDSKVKENK